VLVDALTVALRKVDALGLDAEALNIRCLIDAGAFDAAGPREALAALEALRGVPKDAAADVAAVRAKLLIALSRPDEARPLLEAALGRKSRRPVRAWLGQALVLLGRFDEARTALDLAVAEEPAYAWAFFFRAAAKLGLQDPAGAAKDSEIFRRRHGGPCADALSGLAAASAGRSAEAVSALRRAAAASPGLAWPSVLESVVHRASGDLSAVKDALHRAAASQPSAWVYAELAKTYEHLGNLPEAIDNAARALRLCPCVEHHLLKAHLHGCWRENAESIAEYASALALSPGDAGLLFSRSKAYSAAGRLPEALADASAAARAQPGDAGLECWEIQLLTLTGGGKEAARRTAALLRRAAGDDALKANAYFCRAYAALCGGDRAAALLELESCLKHAAGTPLERKADFYRVLATVPEEAEPELAGGPAPGFYMIGLGVDPPYTATAAGLRALARCDVVFNNVMGDEMFEFLRPFCRDCRPVAYHQNNDEEKLAAEMLAEVRPGRVVAFVTRGSAIVQGPLGTLLLDRCLRDGIGWRCLAAVSSAELLGAKFGETVRQEPGQAVIDSRAVPEDGLGDPRLPLTLFLNMAEPEKEYPALCRVLAKRYGKDHPCLILDHVIGQIPRPAKMADLAGLRESLSASAIFFIPGKVS
jgi:tetratricopeptide (TPR) repeat protein